MKSLPSIKIEPLSQENFKSFFPNLLGHYQGECL